MEEKDPLVFKPGDRVTLNEAGLEFFEARRFPAQIGAVYTNILAQNTEVVRSEGDTVWLKFITPRYPLNDPEKNRCGVRREHLRAAGPGKGTV